MGREICEGLIFMNVKWQKLRGTDISVWAFSPFVLDQNWKLAEKSLASLLPGFPSCPRNNGAQSPASKLERPRFQCEFCLWGSPCSLSLGLCALSHLPVLTGKERKPEAKGTSGHCVKEKDGNRISRENHSWPKYWNTSPRLKHLIALHSYGYKCRVREEM